MYSASDGLQIYGKNRPCSLLQPGFHMSGKSQTVWDFTVSRPSQILLRLVFTSDGVVVGIVDGVVRELTTE